MSLRGDGLSDDGEAFQSLLDRAEGLVEIPAGRYLIGKTLRIRGNTRLRLDSQSIVTLAEGAARTCHDYLLTNAHPEAGDCDISVEGGQWDGNNRGNPRPPGLFDEGYSGAMFHFRNTRDLRLKNLHVRNAEAYHIRLTHTREFCIEDIAFSAERVRNNNDGIHLGGNCSQGIIRRIKGLHPGVTGDDMVALNADDALGRTEVRGMTCGPIEDILIEDIQADGCHSFVRLLSVWSAIGNIRINGVKGSCEVAALNCDAARGCRVPLFEEANPPFANGVGLIKNIEASDFFVSKSKPNNIALLRMETRMENVRLQNFRRNLASDMDPGVPALRVQYAGASLLLNKTAHRVPFGECFESNEPEIDELVINRAG